MGILDELDDDIDLGPPVDETPEDKLYREQTEGKMPRIHNCVYWLKHELHVYNHILEKNWHVSKLVGAGRAQVSYKELSRVLLEYYFLMTQLPRFEGEDAKRRGTAVDMQKFIDKVLEYPTIQKLLENPTLLI